MFIRLWRDENYEQIILIKGKATRGILDDYALTCYNEHIDSFLSYNNNIEVALVDTFKILNSQVMDSGVVKESNFKFGLACIFLTIAAILGLAREFSVMKKEKFCKIPDHIKIGPQ